MYALPQGSDAEKALSSYWYVNHSGGAANMLLPFPLLYSANVLLPFLLFYSHIACLMCFLSLYITGERSDCQIDDHQSVWYQLI